MNNSLENFTIRTANRLIGNPSLSVKQWLEWLRRISNAVENIEKKQHVQKLIDYFEGNQLEYLRQILDEQFDDSESLLLQLECSNIIKMIIDRISIIYKNNARRELYGGEFSEKQEALFEWLINSSKYKRIMDTANQIVNLCGTAIIRPWFSERKQCIELDILTQADIDILPDPENITEALGVFYKANSDNLFTNNWLENGNTVYHYWDSEQYTSFTDNDFVKVKDNPYNVNPYGVIPFVRITNRLPFKGYFIESGDDLISVQESINIKLTELNYLLKMQSFIVPVLIGYDPSETDRINVSPGNPIVIRPALSDEQTSDFKFETPSPDISALTNEIDNKIRRLAQNYGLAVSDFVISASPSSGLALSIQNRHLLDRFYRELPYYENGEREVFELIKTIWNYHADYLPKNHEFYGVKFDKKTKLLVSINKPLLFDNPEENRNKWEFLFQNGICTKEDFLREEMNLSESEVNVTK